MNLEAALGAMLAISCLVGMVQEAKEATIRTIGIVGLVVGGFFLAYHHVSLLREIAYPSGVLYLLIAATAAVDGLLLTLKAKNQVVGTCAVVAGAQLLLLTMGAIRG